MSCVVFVDTIGFEFNLTVQDCDTGDVIDISAGNGTLTLDVRKPSDDDHSAAEIVEWTPTIINGPTGTAQYKTADGDLDRVGTYTIQGHWDPVSAEEDFYSDKISITVRERVR